MLFIPAKGAEAQPGQVQPEQGQKAVKIHGVPGRTGNAQQVQRVADYIVVQGGENIAAVAQAEVPLGQHQLMFRQQCAQYSTAILAKINKRGEVLFPPIAGGDQTAPGAGEPHINTGAANQKGGGVQQKVCTAFGYATVCGIVFVYFHFSLFFHTG